MLPEGRIYINVTTETDQKKKSVEYVSEYVK